jgi:hypothetical protein
LVNEGGVEFFFQSAISAAITASCDLCSFDCELICELSMSENLMLCSAVYSLTRYSLRG